jgi:hypothetical protein
MISEMAFTIALILAILCTNFTVAMAISKPPTSAGITHISLNTAPIPPDVHSPTIDQIVMTTSIHISTHTNSKRDFGTCIDIFETGNHLGKSIHNVCSAPNACISLGENAGFDVIGSISFKGSTWCVVYSNTKCTPGLNDALRIVMETSSGFWMGIYHLNRLGV